MEPKNIYEFPNESLEQPLRFYDGELYGHSVKEYSLINFDIVYNENIVIAEFDLSNITEDCHGICNININKPENLLNYYICIFDPTNGKSQRKKLHYEDFSLFTHKMPLLYKLDKKFKLNIYYLIPLSYLSSILI